jgi:DNA-3-methyladenine glycosylase II
MQTLIIDTSHTFSFPACLWYLNQWGKHECMHEVEGKTFKKAVRLESGLVYFEISAPSPAQLKVDFITMGNAAKVKDPLKAYIIAFFDLDTDLAPFYQLAEQHGFLQPLIQKLFGLRIVGIPDLFEALCWAITGQQINLAFAYTLKRRLVAAFGNRVEHEEHTYFVFPKAAAIAQLSVSELTDLKFSAQKATYIIGVAKAIANGELTKAALQALPFAQAKARLLQLKGIGNWTANYVLMKSLQMQDAFPIEDVGLHNALKKLMQLPHKPDLATIEQWAKPWTGWRAYVTFYLWQTLLDHE